MNDSNDGKLINLEIILCVQTSTNIGSNLVSAALFVTFEKDSGNNKLETTNTVKNYYVHKQIR